MLPRIELLLAGVKEQALPIYRQWHAVVSFLFSATACPTFWWHSRLQRGNRVWAAWCGIGDDCGPGVSSIDGTYSRPDPLLQLDPDNYVQYIYA